MYMKLYITYISYILYILFTFYILYIFYILCTLYILFIFHILYTFYILYIFYIFYISYIYIYTCKIMFCYIYTHVYNMQHVAPKRCTFNTIGCMTLLAPLYVHTGQWLDHAEQVEKLRSLVPLMCQTCQKSGIDKLYCTHSILAVSLTDIQRFSQHFDDFFNRSPESWSMLGFQGVVFSI